MSIFDTEPEAKIKAIAPWFGGKRSMADRIARECCKENGDPPKAFWDVACGGMPVTLAMPRCSHMTVNDLHGDLINLAHVLQSETLGPRLYRRLRRVFCHEGLFYESKEALEAGSATLDEGLFGAEPKVEVSPIDRAFHFFIVSWMGRNGVAGTKRTNYQPAIRWTSGGGHGGVRFANAVDSIPAWRRRLRDLTILQRNLFDVLPNIEDQVGTSIYIDPPYLRDGETRTGDCAYEHEFSERDHKRLCDIVRGHKHSRIVISYYDHPILREWYDGWTFSEATTQKNLHVQNRRGQGRCEAPEVLIINGPSYYKEAA